MILMVSRLVLVLVIVLLSGMVVCVSSPIRLFDGLMPIASSMPVLGLRRVCVRLSRLENIAILHSLAGLDRAIKVQCAFPVDPPLVCVDIALVSRVISGLLVVVVVILVSATVFPCPSVGRQLLSGRFDRQNLTVARLLVSPLVGT